MSLILFSLTCSGYRKISLPNFVHFKQTNLLLVFNEKEKMGFLKKCNFPNAFHKKTTTFSLFFHQENI